MARFEWMAIVCATWLFSEFLAWAALGWPIDWREAPTVICVCLIAVLTFPPTPDTMDKEQE